MSAFERGADFYDLLYDDKDYARETAFVRRRILKYAPQARSVLDLGCGTARHACEFARLGWHVLAVDRSRQMIRKARSARRQLAESPRSRLRLEAGDVRRYRAPGGFDAATSLFHVVNYQTTRAGLLGLFRSARRALQRGGVFLFDFWYGPAVQSDPPAIRIKRVQDRRVRIERFADPVHRPNRRLVEVHHTLSVVDHRTGRRKKFEETHVLRYLFLPEIRRLGMAAGFRLVESGQWLTRKPLTPRTWLGYAVLCAV